MTARHALPREDQDDAVEAASPSTVSGRHALPPQPDESHSGPLRVVQPRRGRHTARPRWIPGPRLLRLVGLITAAVVLIAAASAAVVVALSEAAEGAWCSVGTSACTCAALACTAAGLIVPWRGARDDSETDGR